MTIADCRPVSLQAIYHNFSYATECRLVSGRVSSDFVKEREALFMSAFIKTQIGE